MKEIQQILKLLDPYADVIESEPLADLRGTDEQLRKQLAAAREKGRNLKIAVIGQMKSGKSSFLNAALFGQHVLPKAETPMTAALTSIVYGSKSRAEVEFYSREDWAVIAEKAAQYEEQYAIEETRLRDEDDMGPYGTPVTPARAVVESRMDQSLVACAELVRKAHEKDLDPAAYFSQTRVIDEVDDVSRLADALQDYVGGGGRFTPITKMTTLHLNDRRLEGLEVIDTPGFNDPVVSRGAITRSHLAHCDVIFLLSPLNQFLGASDMKVFREQLPEAGLGDKTVFLVGTQRDLPLRQDGGLVVQAARVAERYPAEQRGPVLLNAMLQLLDRKMTAIAKDAFAGQMRREGNDQRTKRLLGELEVRQPRFISSWAWLVAQDLGKLSGDDRDQYERLCRDTGIEFDAERLRILSNIPPVFEEIVAQRKRKRELLEEKEGQLADSSRALVRRRLEEIKLSLAARRQHIQSGNIAELERLERQATDRLERGKAKLEDVFDEQAAAAKTKFARLKSELRRLSQDYTKLDAVKETKSESYQVDTSWFKGLFGHTWETRYRDVETVYASVQDAIEKIDRYAHECIDRFESRIADCVDLDKLRKNVCAAAIALFDTGSADFDGDLMLSGINKSLRRITIPTVDLGKRDFTSEITKQFGTGRVSESNVEGLQRAHRAAIQTVTVAIEKLVDDKIAEIENSLARSAQTFVGDMSRDIKADLQKLREQRADREATLERIESATRAVERALA